MTKTLFSATAMLLILFGAMQLIPYRVDNPLTVQEPTWDSTQTEELARAACYDCHSNEVNVPWYGKVAPVSWLVKNHVDEGREELNFSEMDRTYEEAAEAGEKVLEGEMPPRTYLWMHEEARLTEAQRQTLAAGLDATLTEPEDEQLRTGL